MVMFERLDSGAYMLRNERKRRESSAAGYLIARALRARSTMPCDVLITAQPQAEKRADGEGSTIDSYFVGNPTVFGIAIPHGQVAWVRHDRNRMNFGPAPWRTWPHRQ